MEILYYNSFVVYPACRHERYAKDRKLQRNTCKTKKPPVGHLPSSVTVYTISPFVDAHLLFNPAMFWLAEAATAKRGCWHRLIATADATCRFLRPNIIKIVTKEMWIVPSASLQLCTNQLFMGYALVWIQKSTLFWGNIRGLLKIVLKLWDPYFKQYTHFIYVLTMFRHSISIAPEAPISLLRLGKVREIQDWTVRTSQIDLWSYPLILYFVLPPHKRQVGR